MFPQVPPNSPHLIQPTVIAGFHENRLTKTPGQHPCAHLHGLVNPAGGSGRGAWPMIGAADMVRNRFDGVAFLPGRERVSISTGVRPGLS